MTPADEKSVVCTGTRQDAAYRDAQSRLFPGKDAFRAGDREWYATLYYHA